MNRAAWNGHLDIIQWLHPNRTEGCTTEAMDWAAKNGHLHVVQWLQNLAPTPAPEPDLSLPSIEDKEERFRRAGEALSAWRDKLDTRERERSPRSRDPPRGGGARRAQLEAEEEELAARHTQLYEDVHRQSSAPECPICLESIAADEAVRTPGDHTFCIGCHSRWLQRTCPICRLAI
ncbi:hypothetical protein L914_14235 [Phytophthora nicotianae]|uniref:RING-type domain-containing protein n=2 Tax=Phytophthora nicotianae TaxID=4792 RepID=V9EM91_PHYNI|nr:hypothetical protein F443_14796 [Phytophthora nicotianae P1569]ETM39620.1 hypothetical protein L914_14235 [Phytophthora nicotianae]